MDDESRARLVAADYEEWKKTVGSNVEDLFLRARRPLIVMLAGYIAAVERKQGEEYSSLRRLKFRSNGDLSDGEVQRFLRDMLQDFLAALRRDRKLCNEVAEEVFRRLNQWPKDML